MSLFVDPTENHLPYDGTVLYYGVIFTAEECERYYQQLLQEIEWKNDEAVVFGKYFITKRKTAWYGNERYSYTYSNTTKHALPWTMVLQQLKQITEEKTKASYNSCLLNLYHDGSEGMAWHSDNEKMLAKHQPIASVTFGAPRKFSFKHKRSGETRSILLENGSLLVMKDDTQDNWLHRLPPTTKVHSPRINLTFRTILV